MPPEQEISAAVVIVAAGRGERLGQGAPKASVSVAGEPILAHALRSVLASDIAAEICVVLPPGRAGTALREICARIQHHQAGRVRPVKMTFTEGGPSRAESVRRALAVLDETVDAVLIHDAARPLTPAQVFHRVRDALRAGAPAVIPALPVSDTVKTGRSSAEPQIAPEQVAGTVARDQLRRVQTPQGFDLRALRRAHLAAEELTTEQTAAITDDAMLLESLGLPVYLVQGSELSLKITTPEDLLLAEALLRGQQGIPPGSGESQLEVTGG